MSFFVFQRKSGLKEKESSTQRVNLQHGLTYYRCLLLRWKEGAEGGARGGTRKPQCGPERIAFHHEHHDIYIEIQEKKARQTSHSVDIFVFFFGQCRCLEEETTTFVRFYEAQLLFHSLAFVFKPLLLFSNARKKLDLDYTNHLTVEKKWCTNCLWWFELN